MRQYRDQGRLLPEDEHIAHNSLMGNTMLTKHLESFYRKKAHLFRAVFAMWNEKMIHSNS